MTPFRLLFNPGSIFRKYPRREWRRTTLWLKWGLLLSFVGVLLRVALISSKPESASSIVYLISYLAEEGDMLLSMFVKIALFFILESIYLVFVWLFRGLVIFTVYKLTDSVFGELSVALSIAGASLVIGIWYLIPYGYFLAFLHSIILIMYLLKNINRTPTFLALLAAVIASAPPLLF